MLASNDRQQVLVCLRTKRSKSRTELVKSGGILCRSKKGKEEVQVRLSLYTGRCSEGALLSEMLGRKGGISAIVARLDVEFEETIDFCCLKLTVLCSRIISRSKAFVSFRLYR